MKKIIVVLGMLVAYTGVWAQGENFNKLYNKYADNPEFTQVSISSAMFKLLADMTLGGSEEDKEVMDMVKKLKGFKMIMKTENAGADKYFKEAKPMFRTGYEELMTVRNDKDEMLFLVREKNDKIEELVMLIGGDKFVAMSFYGEIDLKKIAKLANKMNVDGFEHLKNLGEDND
jgi:hypothetical protein